MKFILLFLLVSILYIFQNNLLLNQENFYIKIIETYDKTDSIKVNLARIIDGDTVEVYFWNEKRKVRIVGYDAYELSESKGLEAKSYLESLCNNAEVFLDVDELESKDKYNRTLGYLWCKKDGEMQYKSVTKSFLILRPDLVKRTLYIPPDEHPYTVWLTQHIILINSNVKVDIYVYNLTGNYKLNSTSLTLTGGYYIIESNLYVNLTELNLLSDKSQKITLEVKYYKETTKTFTETVTVTEQKWKTEFITKTEKYTLNYTITSLITSSSMNNFLLYIFISFFIITLILLLFIKKIRKF